MLDGAIEEALLAVDLYNQPRKPRRLEGFFVHMHLAWLYLLHAEFKRDGIDFRYRLGNGRFERVDGEPKTWDLKQSAAQKWPNGGAVRANLELTIALRNKIEHRYHEAVTLVSSGYAQALLLNFEDEVTASFGTKASLGEQLRFPIFVGELTALGEARIRDLEVALPKSTRDFLAGFESGLDPSITRDQRYEFRVTLVQKIGPKQSAERALTFVRESDLTSDERAALDRLGRTGSVVVREQMRPVVSAGLMRPSVAVERIAERIPMKFHMGHFIQVWRKLGCRPRDGDPHPERTDERYCIYDVPHRDYLYTKAFVDKVVRETSTAEKFEQFLGRTPVPKAIVDDDETVIERDSLPR